MSKVWFITGASRGIGAELARAVLASGDAVVAAARRIEGLEDLFGGSNRLLTVTLDVTEPAQAAHAVQTAIDRFERIDVLVNNAGYGLLGALEECSAKELAAQFETNVFGLWSVTRAVLPIMRAQRSGHIINIGSSSGLVGFAAASAYCATKFAVEGLSEALAKELAPLGIKVTIIEPGTTRTQFLTGQSVRFAEQVICDYEASSGASRARVPALNGKQPGDPQKLAQAILAVAAADPPPLRFLAGADTVRLFEQSAAAKVEELKAWRDLSVSLGYDD